MKSKTDIKLLLRVVSDAWKQRQKDVLKAIDNLEGELGAQLTRRDRENLQIHRERFGNAVQDLVRRARSPELVLATTGTTSSGKSTLANFLIGDDLLPSAVQEMSAGLVAVRHHESRHTLKIPSTRGATWETGEWDDLDATQLRHRLEKTMHAFREAEKHDKDIEPVFFQIDWPIRLAGEYRKLGLPEDTQLTLLDLPGLKSINDERNGPLIRENISQALCLVAYNAEETDDRKQRQLLDQIVHQITALRRSKETLGRMLFLLNRVDAFTRNENPEESLADFRRQVTDQLRSGLGEALPEERAVIETISPCALSSLPALWATQAKLCDPGSARQTQLLEEIEAQFNKIFWKGYWKAYPRDFSELASDQRHRLIEDTLTYSKANEFEERLVSHIGNHLPEIVLSGPVTQAYTSAGALLAEADQLIESHMVRTADEAQAAKAQLAEAERALQAEVDQAAKLFDLLKTGKSGEEFDTQDLGEGIETLRANLNLSPEEVRPLLDMTQDLLVKPFNQIADYCETFLQGGEGEPGRLAFAAGFDAFNEALEALRASPFGKVWREGACFADPSEVEGVEKALERFGESLSTVATELFQRAGEDSGARSKICLDNINVRILSQIEQIAEDKLPDLIAAYPGLRRTFQNPVELPPFQGSVVSFSPDIKEWETVVQEGERGSLLHRILVAIRLAEKKIIERKEDGIEVGGIGDILSGFFASSSYKQGRAEIGAYFENLTNFFKKTLDDRLGLQIGQYSNAIDMRAGEISQTEREVQDILKRHKTTLGEFHQEHASWKTWKEADALPEPVGAEL